MKPNYNPRKITYEKFLTDDESPIILDKNKSNSKCNFNVSYEKFSVEPFYQLMRQTLLAWQLAKSKRYGATDYMHIHVIPNLNDILLNGKTSPEITNGQRNICSAWGKWLKIPEKYVHIDPSVLLGNVAKKHNKLLNEYLEQRYWR